MRYAEVGAALGEHIPVLRGLIEAHRAANAGEVLPQILFGELVAVAQQAALEGNTALLSELAEFLELCAASDDPLMQDLISTGFVENLAPFRPDFGVLYASLGPQVRRELERQRRSFRGR